MHFLEGFDNWGSHQGNEKNDRKPKAFVRWRNAIEKSKAWGAFICVLVRFAFHFPFPGVKVGAVGRVGKGKEKPFGLWGTRMGGFSRGFKQDASV